MRTGITLLAAWLAGWLGAGCSGRHLTRVETGDRDGILYLGNSTEPRELDPEIMTGIPESNIVRALYEPLVNLDPADLHPIPGVAQSWDISADGLVYTFHLRADATWSNGVPLTAHDFAASFQRTLAPKLAAEFAEFLWLLKGASEFNHGLTTDFSQVGVHALDDHTLQLELVHPASYFLGVIAGRTWYPVYLPGIEKFGAVDDRTNQRWTLPENFVGNGPFVLREWVVNQRIVAQKNPKYWDAAHTRLNQVNFYPIDDVNGEERDFRAGQLHKTGGSLPLTKIDVYRRDHPELLHIDPYLGIYYFQLNTTKPPLDDVRVRRALGLSIDRESIVKNVTRGGQRPTGTYTPIGLGGYTCAAPMTYDPDGARRLLAEAGHAGGAGLPPIDLLFNTSDVHREIAEAAQRMWKKELGIDVRLSNQEWKVYLDERKSMNYSIARAGWIGTFLDPLAFLENFLKDGANNHTGFANADYDRLIGESQREIDPAARLRELNAAETILLTEAPVIPLYDYTNQYLLQPSVQGWESNVLDYHLYQRVSLRH